MGFIILFFLKLISVTTRKISSYFFLKIILQFLFFCNFWFLQFCVKLLLHFPILHHFHFRFFVFCSLLLLFLIILMHCVQSQTLNSSNNDHVICTLIILL